MSKVEVELRIGVSNGASSIEYWLVILLGEVELYCGSCSGIIRVVSLDIVLLSAIRDGDRILSSKVGASSSLCSCVEYIRGS